MNLTTKFSLGDIIYPVVSGTVREECPECGAFRSTDEIWSTSVPMEVTDIRIAVYPDQILIEYWNHNRDTDKATFCYEEDAFESDETALAICYSRNTKAKNDNEAI